MHDRAIIIMTRTPQAGKTKTRMMPYLTGSECGKLHRAFLGDLAELCGNYGADIFIYYTGENIMSLVEIFSSSAVLCEQRGAGLGERMHNAISEVLGKGYKSCLLIGSDVPTIGIADFDAAFNALDKCEVVFGPAFDGGYYLVGMNEPCERAFSLAEYGHDKVLEQTLAALPTDMSYELIGEQRDIDDIADLRWLRENCRQNTNTADFLREHSIISVVIPVYNEATVLPRFFGDMRRAFSECEVIFVDGGSTDESLRIIQSEAVKHANWQAISSDKGRGAQMNRGAEIARGDVLLFLHADSALPFDPVAEIRDTLRKHDAGCFGVDFGGGNFFMWTNRIISNCRAFWHKVMFGDQGIFVRRKIFDEMGGFAEIPLMEDYRFSLDIKQRGVKVGHTRHRIRTSARRYEGNTRQKLAVMHKMYRLRKRYLAGEEIEKIAQEYADIR